MVHHAPTTLRTALQRFRGAQVRPNVGRFYAMRRQSKAPARTGASGVSKHDYAKRRFITPAIPRRPVPSRAMLEGSGVTDEGGVDGPRSVRVTV